MFSDSRLLCPLSQAKQLELQFTVGEAITSAAVGTSSVAARDAWLLTEDEYTPPAGTSLKSPFLVLLPHLKRKKKSMRSMLTLLQIFIYVLSVWFSQEK